jgi:cell division transport system ATP-binding protein
MTNSRIIISLNNVSIFQQNNLILSDVNLSINEGDFVYMIGKTGSGKSSLLKVLYGELPIEKGAATLSEFDLTKLKNAQLPLLRRKLGMVFQDFQLLIDRSVFENLAFVLRATGWKNEVEIDQRIKEVLSQVDLGTKLQKMPFELSGGEQQRVAIARALLNNPTVILADEPTGNLDPQTSNDIIKLLHQICLNGTAVLMATHDYRIIEKYPSTIIRCLGGKLINQASLSDIKLEVE